MTVIARFLSSSEAVRVWFLLFPESVHFGVSCAVITIYFVSMFWV